MKEEENTPKSIIQDSFKNVEFIAINKQQPNKRKGVVASFSDDNTKEQELLGKIAKNSRIFVLPEIEPLNGE